MNIDIVVFIVAFVASFLLSIAVMLRDPKSATNQLFFWLVLSMLVWSTVNVLSYRSAETLILARLVLFFAVIFATIFFLFAHTFPSRHLKIAKRWLVLGSLLSLITMGAVLSPLVFKGITPVGNDIGQPVIGPGIGLFGFTVFLYDFGGLFIILKKLQRSKTLLRMQYRYLLLGLSLMLITIIIFNFIFPTALKNTNFIPYASAFTFPFLAFMSYAIIRHRLLAIRLVIARSIAYVLLLLTIVSLAGLGIFGITEFIFQSGSVSLVQNLVYVSIVLVLAFSFQSLKKFYSRVTNRLFYKDNYDSQAVLNDLGNLFASEISINTIMKKSLTIISRNLELTHATFFVIDKGKIHKSQTIGNPRVDSITIKELSHLHKSIIVTDELEGGLVKPILDQHDMAASLHLRTQDGTVGYVLLGPKQSGEIYTDQDIRLVEILNDELAVAIQNTLSYEKIAEFNITLQKRIEEATHELRLTNKRLQELDKAKDDFISMASHQLRTPLTAIKGYLSMLDEGDAGKITKQQDDFVGRAFASAQKMIYLINDMLNVSRINTGKLTFDIQSVNLLELVEGEIAQVEGTAREKNVKLVFHEPKGKMPELKLDSDKMRQVIMNFIDNAIYYAPNSTVEIFLENIGEEVEFKVVDHGIGVPKVEQGHLFTKFYRASNAKQQRPDGTGLGLYMAKMVIEIQGGKIIFESQEGKGSTFGFRLPIKATQSLKMPKKLARAAAK